MKITFLNFEQFRNMENKYKKYGAPLCSGFGLGTNVSAFLRINGVIYARLTPIAYPEFAGRTIEIKDDSRTARDIDGTLNYAGQ